MKKRASHVFGIHAPPARMTWQAAALIAMSVALPGGAIIHWVWG